MRKGRTHPQGPRERIKAGGAYHKDHKDSNNEFSELEEYGEPRAEVLQLYRVDAHWELLLVLQAPRARVLTTMLPQHLQNSSSSFSSSFLVSCSPGAPVTASKPGSRPLKALPTRLARCRVAVRECDFEGYPVALRFFEVCRDLYEAVDLDFAVFLRTG